MVRNCFDDPLESLTNKATHGESSSTLFVERALDLLCAQVARPHSAHAPLETSAPRHDTADWRTKRVADSMEEFIDQR